MARMLLALTALTGERFFTGSLATGAVYSGSLRTGQGAPLVQPQEGRIAVGMKEDRGLFVAGGNTGNASSTTRRPARTSPRTSSRAAAASSTTSSSRRAPPGSPTRSSPFSTAFRSGPVDVPAARLA
jgi:hypothetical protein